MRSWLLHDLRRGEAPLLLDDWPPFDHYCAIAPQNAVKSCCDNQQWVFLVFDTTVQSQQNPRFNVSSHFSIVVFRLNTYFQLYHFIFCVAKTIVLSSVFVAHRSKFSSLLKVVFSCCWTTILARYSTQLNLLLTLFPIHLASILNFV